jgi:hypothetical protein
MKKSFDGQLAGLLDWPESSVEALFLNEMWRL